MTRPLLLPRPKDRRFAKDPSDRTGVAALRIIPRDARLRLVPQDDGMQPSRIDNSGAEVP